MFEFLLSIRGSFLAVRVGRMPCRCAATPYWTFVSLNDKWDGVSLYLHIYSTLKSGRRINFAAFFKLIHLQYSRFYYNVLKLLPVRNKRLRFFSRTPIFFHFKTAPSIINKRRIDLDTSKQQPVASIYFFNWLSLLSLKINCLRFWLTLLKLIKNCSSQLWPHVQTSNWFSSRGINNLLQLVANIALLKII